MLVEVCLFDLYFVQKSVFNNLVVNNVMLYMSCVIIIYSSPALLEHDNGAGVEVHVDSWV